MATPAAVIVERPFTDVEGRVTVIREPEWKVACWDAIDGLPDDEARWWALEMLLWGFWERGGDLERILAFARKQYQERDAQNEAEYGPNPGEGTI